MVLPLDALPRDEGDYVGCVVDNTAATVNATFPLTRGIYVGAAGNLEVTMADGVDVTFTGLLAGTTLPIRAIGTVAAGTTLSNLLRLY